MPVGVVDVGSNTVRLHVAHDGRTIHRERSVLALGDAVERFGVIPEPKLAELGATVADYVAQARESGADVVEVLVTSPGRQAVNGPELITRLEGTARAPVRLLSAADEARLGFAGALADTRVAAGRRVAVVDVGGGSTEIAVGTRGDGPSWIGSVDLGSMRLTSRCLPGDPPGLEALRAARREAETYLRALEPPPQPRVGFAAGGSARALRRLAGCSRLGSEEFEAAIECLALTPAAEVAARFDVDLGRARTLAAGTVILAAVGELLDVRFRIGRGGVREGAALELERRRLAAQVLLLVRHASAGKRDEWTGDDLVRPLDERGARQAEALVELLSGYSIERILSSPAVRCLATVEPLARSRGLQIEVRAELAEEKQWTDGAALMRTLAAADVLACGHGGLERATLTEPPRWKKGDVFVVDESLTVRHAFRP